MRINYNSWFYEQHRYLQGSKDGYTSYNDTKWNNIFRRMKTLVDLQSQLIHEQPFSVVANYAGMNRLVGLLDKTDYTFQDIDEALVDTYKRSLKNAMSNMVVNTHAVIATGRNTDKNITRDPMNTDYYVIDVPYQQLHFGDRDEVIRQQLQNMFARSRNNYLTSTDFINENLVNLMGFTLICACNGLICHDWMVALDDKGFHFKIAWRKSYDCDFIIYKLDKTIVKTFTINRPKLQKNNVIPASVVDIPVGTKCIINIYDPQYPDDSAPNFGTMTDAGIVISGLQFTPTALGYTNTTDVTAVVYGLKYLHEVPNVYPSVNYFDMVRDQTVYTEDGSVRSDSGYVTGRSQHITADTLCTPPICVDRPVIDSFNTVLQCIKMRERLMKHKYRFNKISTRTTAENPVAICRTEKEYMESEFVIYKRGGILTSWVSADDIAYFQNVIDRMQAFIDAPGNGFAEASTSKFNAMVNRICGPFERDSVKLFRELSTAELTRRYFDVEEDLATRINRPISEQCIIALKYNPDNNCWIFTAPDIKHFHGIGNTFYIDTGLVYGEVYKFFFLYTDTEAPGETNIEQMPFDQVFDYDKFEAEVDKHLGYIRYWNVENHLRKLSKILYSDDSTEIQNQVLSEMLRKKFNGDEFIDTYPSNMNYEPSNASTLNVDGDEHEDEAPFAVNFMFYTVSMMFDNSDKMLMYFISRLNKSNNRYDDMPFVVPDVYKATVNYSIWRITSLSPDTSHALKDGRVHLYYGYPGAIGADGETMTLGNYSSSYGNFAPYNYTFHIEPNNKYPLIRDDGSIDEEYYITAGWNGAGDISVNIRFAQYCTEYMQRLLDAVAYVARYNTTSMTRGNIIQNYHNRLVEKYDELIAYEAEHLPRYSIPQYVKTAMADINTYLESIVIDANSIRKPGFPKDMDWYSYINKFLSIFRDVYNNIGFDDVANYRVKALYEHLSKINSGLPLYEFSQWLEDIDLDILLVLDSMVSNNPEVKRALNLSSTYFEKVHDVLAGCIETTKTTWLSLKDKTTYFDSMITSGSYDIMHTYVYDMMMNSWLKTNYIIDSIDFDECVLDTKPAYICAWFDLDYEYRYGYYDQASNCFLVFKPDVTEEADGFHITGLRPICEYACFGGYEYNNGVYVERLTSGDVVPIDDYGNSISYTGTNFSIHLKQISMTCDTIGELNVLPNTMDTHLDFQNIHNTHDVVDGKVVDVNCANMNYELLAGGRFMPLKHETEMILDRETFEAKPIDRVRISNYDINTFVKSNLCDHGVAAGYIRPVHIVIYTNPGALGRYELGDTICVKVHPRSVHFGYVDPKYAFTAKITAITHSESHAVIEADIDPAFTEWRQISIHDFIYWLPTGYNLSLGCQILDDNFRNFMDEFHDSGYSYYPIPPLPEGTVTPETLPGDPLFVSEYSDYVYTRLEWFFSPNVPNRFPDDAHKTYDFVYIGAGSFIPEEGMTVKLLNHNWNSMDLSEMYPTLKDNNGEYAVRAKEKQTYENLIEDINTQIRGNQQTLDQLLIEYGELTNTYEKQKLLIQIEELRLKIKQDNAFKTRLQDYIEQPELPATWYNLYSYDDAIGYINNGRATSIRIPRSRVYDILYTDAIEVKLYDWEHKVWINPDEYTVTLNTTDLFDTSRRTYYREVQYTLVITPTSNTFSSKKVLVYFVYKTSDIYDTIPDGPDNHGDDGDISVWPKYTFELGDTSKFHDIYSAIRIRKHYDTNESYRLNDYITENDTFIVDRIRRSGKYSFVSDVRWSDVTIKTGSSEYTLDDFDVYYEFPYPNVDTPQVLKSLSYSTSVIADIDDATDGDVVTLVAMNNSEYSSSDGSTSSALFLARINIVEEQLTVTILDSTVGLVDGTFRCFVAKDPAYKSCGGIIRVNTGVSSRNVTLDETGKWYKVTNDVEDRIVPNRFMIIPHDGVVVNDTTSLELHNNYELNTDNDVNAYTYFYDTKYHVRYPMSNVLMDNHSERFDIDTEENTSVKKIKSNYMGICRYSRQRIPSNGLIDLTGYIATPLTRSNYEFWINGRCLNNEKNLIILSPTIIQLTNVTSLRNFEVIELVHDVNDSELRPHGPIYSDLAGNMFGSYIQALTSNKAIRYQTVKYSFGTNIQSGLDKYANDIIDKPNNVDVEPDILANLDSDETATSYQQLYNIPSINGIPLRHPTIEDLGMMEIPGEEIISMYNKTWAYEICTRNNFPLTHMDLLNTSERVRLHASIFENQYRVYTTGICSKYFTLYISDAIDGTPIQVIPMIQLGTSILLPISYEGKWIRCTFPNTAPIQLK